MFHQPQVGCTHSNGISGKEPWKVSAGPRFVLNIQPRYTPQYFLSGKKEYQYYLKDLHEEEILKPLIISSQYCGG